MKKLILLIYCCCCMAIVRAQDSTQVFRFGYLSYEQALKALPDYALVRKSMDDLRAQYEAEQKRVEQDFNMKYEEFLEGQRDFPETILRKRQTELKELLERNLAFKAESRQQLQKAETEALAPLKQFLSETLTAIGFERGYAFILNTDAGSLPFIHPAVGEDISQVVLERLTIKESGVERQ